MRLLAKIFIAFSAIIILVLLFAPREPIEGPIEFSATALGDDLDAYLAAEEAQFDDITPGVEKRIIWAKASGERTDTVIVYVHGFSATSEEIRPVPDRVAEVLGANLLYTRLDGHGRDGAAMAQATVPNWITDYAEAMAIAARLGDKVIVMATSTGAPIATIAHLDPRIVDQADGFIMVSPNFKVANPAAAVLTLPLVRYWGPIVAGYERSFEPANEGQATYWTTSYPTIAALPMAAVVQAAGWAPVERILVPALFIYSVNDQVVDHNATADIAEGWGGEVTIVNPVMGEGDDPYAHVISGDILSPGQTDATVETMVRWIATH